MTYWAKTLTNFCFNSEKTGLTFDKVREDWLLPLTTELCVQQLCS